MDNAVTRRVLALGLLVAPAACATPHANALSETPTALDARLAPLNRFVGRWRGTAEGEPGRGTVERSYTPILGGKFIEERNESRYQSGEIHHHIGYWSFDRNRARFVFRQFHQESFVNQFLATTADFTSEQLIVESEAIENIAIGYRARETYRFSYADGFEEVFEIAEPNGDFEVYSRNRFTRA